MANVKGLSPTFIVMDDGKTYDVSMVDKYPPNLADPQPLITIEWDAAAHQSIVTMRERGALSGRVIRRTFPSSHEANQWIAAGFAYEMWQATEDKTWTVTWSPAKRAWTISNGDRVEDTHFLHHADAMRYLGQITERHATAEDRSKMKDTPKTYGEW